MTTSLPKYKPMTIPERLDAIKAKNGITSDYKLALLLRLGETAVANYRKGRSLPDIDAINKIAEAMEEDPALLAAEVEAFRAKTMTAKVLWATVVALLHTSNGVRDQRLEQEAKLTAKRLLDKISKGGGDGLRALTSFFVAVLAALPLLLPRPAEAAPVDITSVAAVYTSYQINRMAISACTCAGTPAPRP